MVILKIRTSISPEKKKEFEQAGEIMGLAVHGSLDIPDSNVSITQENKLKIIQEIRKYKPTVVFAPYWVVRHPDHGHCSHVVREAAYFSGLKKIDTGQEPYRPRKIIFYALRYEFTPSFIVDISHVYERKLEAIAAYKSQFYRADVLSDAENNVLISSPEFLDFISTRAKYWGGKIGVKYAEPFLVREPIRIDDPVQLFEGITLV